MRTQVVVVMGVAGTGKTTIGPRLAARLGVPYAEGDDFHPAANIARMTAGTPLTDDDRWPWLDAIGAWAHHRSVHGGVVSSSALKRAYRDRLRAAAPGLVFVHLAGERRLVEERMGRRAGHFMPTALLDSQYADLQPLQADEVGVTVDVSGTPDEITDRAVRAVRALRAGHAAGAADAGGAADTDSAPHTPGSGSGSGSVDDTTDRPSSA